MIATTKANLIEMFLDRTAGESTRQNRLITRETESGNVELIAYGWLKIAEYSEERNDVTIFTGHKSLNSHTVNRYLNDVLRGADNRSRETIISGGSPNVDTPNAGVKYINNYVSMEGERSAVEEIAVSDVENQLDQIAA